MIEELKIIAEIFKNATDGALYAYIGYLFYGLLKISLIVFPISSVIKFIVSKSFIVEENDEN